VQITHELREIYQSDYSEYSILLFTEPLSIDASMATTTKDLFE